MSGLENLRRRLSFDRLLALRSIDTAVGLGAAAHEAASAAIKVTAKDGLQIEYVNFTFRGQKLEALCPCFIVDAPPEIVCAYFSKLDLRKQWEFYVQRVLATEPLALPPSSYGAHSDVTFSTEETSFAPLLRFVRQERKLLRGSLRLGPEAGERAGGWVHFRIDCVPGAQGYTLPPEPTDVAVCGATAVACPGGTHVVLWWIPHESFASRVWRLFFLTNTTRYIMLVTFRLAALKLVKAILGRPRTAAAAAEPGALLPPVRELARRRSSASTASASANGSGSAPSSGQVECAQEDTDASAVVERFASLVLRESEAHEAEVAAAAAALGELPPPPEDGPHAPSLAGRFEQRRRRASLERTAALRAVDEAAALVADLYRTCPHALLEARPEDGVLCDFYSPSWRGQQPSCAAVAFCAPLVTPDTVCAFFTSSELRRTWEAPFHRTTAASVVEYVPTVPGESLEYVTDELGFHSMLGTVGGQVERYLRGTVHPASHLPGGAAGPLRGARLHVRIACEPRPPADRGLDRCPYTIPHSLLEGDVKLVLAVPLEAAAGCRVLVWWLPHASFLLRNFSAFLIGRTTRYVASKVVRFLMLRLVRRLLDVAAGAPRALPGVAAALSESANLSEASEGAASGEDEARGARLDCYLERHSEMAQVEIAMATASLRDGPPSPARPSPALPFAPPPPPSPGTLLHPPLWNPVPGTAPRGLSAAFATVPRGVLHRAPAAAGPPSSPPAPGEPAARPWRRASRPLQAGQPGPSHSASPPAAAVEEEGPDAGPGPARRRAAGDGGHTPGTASGSDPKRPRTEQT